MASSTSPSTQSNSTTRPIRTVNNVELYNRWAKVYDTDGNILQALDTQHLPPLLTQAYTLLSSTSSTQSITITELGCGTGRNTAKLLLPSPSPSHSTISTIHALDLSPSMLDLAKQRCEKVSSILAITTTAPPPSINYHVFDALSPTSTSSLNISSQAHLVLSTLVLEHLPLPTFFSTVANFLKPGGVLVLTNMHADMGRVSQAGFVDTETGEKVRGTSYVYEIDEVVEEGKKWGFEVSGEVVERGVREEDVGVGEGRVLGERGRKWIGVKVWFGLIMRLGE